MNLNIKVKLILLLFCAVSPVLATGPDSAKVRIRLSKIEKEIPLPYHEALLNEIKSYNTRPLSVNFFRYESYFSEELAKLELPEELRYLPIALTQMNTVHQMNGRAGVWALPPLVAIRYGLTVDANHDERFSVEASTKAALQYLKDLHETFGDWWLSLLAYTNSPAAVNQAKVRHPELSPNPWDYYDLDGLLNASIPCDFIASYYVYSVENQSVELPNEEFVECSFNQPIAVASISDKTGISKPIILSLNPVFRSDPFIPFDPYQIKLPQSAAQAFEENKAAMYSETAQRLVNKTVEEKKPAATEKPKTKSKTPEYLTYTVKSGDYLGKIASKYNVSVKDIKKWNKLKNDKIREGQKLKIYR